MTDIAKAIGEWLDSAQFIIIHNPQKMAIKTPTLKNNMLFARGMLNFLRLRMKCPSGHHFDEHFEFDPDPPTK